MVKLGSILYESNEYYVLSGGQITGESLFFEK